MRCMFQPERGVRGGGAASACGVGAGAGGGLQRAACGAQRHRAADDTHRPGAATTRLYRGTTEGEAKAVSHGYTALVIVYFVMIDGSCVGTQCSQCLHWAYTCIT